ncbi:hypothetical protein [Hufsiella ginkgonis]|uniref:Uncharacterized protein n=1 Tax=Hufsiella ginkgonis TaxID=2695274 RepID=A0A7K1XUX1_9SPHI|nr:hypothetical protein [Hufsiella ginkgonis]MXV14782.1 hypothetical protein [Hufsiella ginkgonis]
MNLLPRLIGRFFFIVLTVVLPLNVFAQDVLPDVHGQKLAGLLKAEQKAGGELFTLKTTFIPESGVAQPFVFRRKQRNLPDLLIYYFFFKRDSAIRYVLYEWDGANFGGYDAKAPAPPATVTAFLNKYNELATRITRTYGIGKTEGDLTGLSKNPAGRYQRSDEWKPNDSTRVLLSSVLSGKYEKRGNTEEIPAYRIRLYLWNESARNEETSTGPPDAEKVARLDAVFRLWLAAVKSKNFAASKAYFSPALRKLVTDVQLAKVGESIRFDEELVIFFSGVQLTLDGTAYPMIQYKYKADGSSPPLELIKVMFDHNGNIAVLQPVKRN